MSVSAKLTAIADAIREKTGKTESLTLDQMAEEISGISGDDDYLGKLIDKQLTELVSDTASGTIPGDFQNGNKNLVKIDMPMVTKIGASAFSNCSNLAEVNLPNVVEIQSNAFNFAWYMPDIYFPNLEKITGYGYNFTATWAQRAYFPKLTRMEAVVGFSRADYLKTFILGASTVCTLNNSNVFENSAISRGTGYIYVPSALVDSYKAATNWSVYANQFRAIEDYPEVLEGWE